MQRGLILSIAAMSGMATAHAAAPPIVPLPAHVEFLPGSFAPQPVRRVQRELPPEAYVLTVDKSGATIEAGRYVSKRVYVGARQSTTGITQLQVDVDLTKHLKLTTRLGNGTATTQGTTPENDPGSSIGMTYQFQY